MSTIRVAKRTRFTVVDRRTIRDERLSFRARGVLIWLLDHPDDWSAKADAIADQGIEGRKAVLTAMRELVDCGYLVRRKWQDAQGLWHHESTVYETPVSDSSDATTIPSPNVGQPPLGFGPVEERTERTTETKPLRGPDDESVVQKIVAGYVDDYRAVCNGHQPSARWRGAAGRAVKTALADGEDPADIATCLDISAREGKNPSTLPNILSDMHANRPRRIQR